jgi:hypothetical protein
LKHTPWATMMIMDH